MNIKAVLGYTLAGISALDKINERLQVIPGLVLPPYISAAFAVVGILGAALNHYAPSPGSLQPTPGLDDEQFKATGQAAGAAGEKASKGPFKS